MLITRNECVGCETCTLGFGCPLLNVRYRFCDVCDPDDEEEAVYNIDGQDTCEDCAYEYLKELFNGCTIEEQADALGVQFERL